MRTWLIAAVVLIGSMLSGGAALAQNCGQISTCPPATLPLTGTEAMVGVQFGRTVQITTGSISGISGSSGFITRAQIPTTLIGLNKSLQVSGFRTPNDLGAGAIYSSVSCSSTGTEAIQDSGGTWFCLVPIRGEFNVGWFGAYGDGGATRVTSGDLAANAWFRGCYTAGTTTWDTVAFTEAIIAAHASPSSTPCVGGVTHISWNIAASGSFTLSWGPAPSGNYGINQQLLDVAQRVIINANLQGCLYWIGSPSTAMLKTNSVAYASYSNLCLTGGVTASTPYSGAPLWVMDHDNTSPGGLSTQQVIVYNGFFNAGGYNTGQLIAINPVGGGGAQGSTIKFIQSEFVCTAGMTAAVQVNGANALDISFDKGDFQVCPTHAVENYGGSVVIDNPTTENQNLFGFFFSPVVDQFTTGGAVGIPADYYGQGVTSGISTINWNRQEGDVSAFCISQCMITGPGYVLGVSSSPTWTAFASGLLTGYTLHDSSAPGRTFILVRDTTDLSGNGPLFWHTIGAGSTVNTVVDPGASWTTNAFTGYGLRARFFGGFTYNTGPIAWNDATHVGLLASFTGAVSGTTLTVSAISQGTIFTAASVGAGTVGLQGAGVPAAASATCAAGSPCTISGTTLTITGTVSGSFLPGGLIDSTAGVTSGTYIVSQTSGTTGGVGTYTVSASQTVTATSVVQAAATISVQLTGSTGGTGTYTVANVGSFTVAAESMTSGNPLPSVPSDEFHIGGYGGSSAPSWSSAAHSTFYVGQVDSGNTGFGFSTVAGSTTVTLGANVSAPTTGQWLCLPGGTYLGPASPLPGVAQFSSIFCTKLTYSGGSTATMDQAATYTLNGVSGYIGTGFSDGSQGLTWMDLDFDVLHNVPVQGPYIAFGFGRVSGANAYGLAPGRPDWNRGQSGSLAAAPLYGGWDGYHDRTAGACPTLGATTAIPVGSGNDFRCSITQDTTLTAPTDVNGKAADLYFTAVSNGVAHTITWGSGFQSGLQPFVTAASGGVETTFHFVNDSHGTWNIPLGVPQSVELGRLIGANMNSTSDQPITLTCPAPKCSIDVAFVTNPSGSLASVTGGIFAGAGGTNPINPALSTSSAWTAMSAAGLSVNLALAPQGNIPSPTPSTIVSGFATFNGSTTVYLHLGTGQGSAATADFYIYGKVLQ